LRVLREHLFFLVGCARHYDGVLEALEEK
jgi:hypothetical protein